MKAVIDTNIILDAFLRRKPFAENARKIMNLAESGKFSGWLNASSITDIYYILRKTLTRGQAKETIQTLMLILDVIEVAKTDLQSAMELEIDDYEDALVASCAKRIKADYIITRNIKDYVSSPISPITPSDFLKKINI